MLTFGLQWLYAVALAGVALLAGRVVRAPGQQPFAQLGWRVTAVAFSLHSADLLVQLVFGAVAMRAGSGSPALQAYLRWAPLFDHSRTFLMLAAAVVLASLALARAAPQPPAMRWRWGLLLGGTLAGALLGAFEGGLLGGGPAAARAVHYAAVAVWDVAELILLLVTLFVLLVRDRIDRFLWSVLAVYACSLALGIFWVTLLAQLGSVWHPPHWTLAALRVVLYGSMAALAAARLRSARGGRAALGMLGPAPARMSTLH